MSEKVHKTIVEGMPRGLADVALQPCTAILFLAADVVNTMIVFVGLAVCLWHRLCDLLLVHLSQQQSEERPARSARSDEALHRLQAAGARTVRSEHQFADAHLWASRL
jgi:hypothetical protein